MNEKPSRPNDTALVLLPPLSSPILAVLAVPFRLQFKRNRPENGKEVFAAFWIYLVILLGLSLPFVLLDWPPGGDWWGWPR